MMTFKLPFNIIDKMLVTDVYKIMLFVTTTFKAPLYINIIN